jgi:uncharacterized Zn finger protein (UPF0148 family)
MENQNTTENVGVDKERDILFDCKFCGKSLVIDRRGAGLMVRCPDCNNELEVPRLDEDMADQKEEEYIEEDGTIKNERLQALLTELDELRYRRNMLEKKQSEYGMCLRAISQQLLMIKKALNQIDDLILSMKEVSGSDTQQIKSVK